MNNTGTKRSTVGRLATLVAGVVLGSGVGWALGSTTESEAPQPRQAPPARVRPAAVDAGPAALLRRSAGCPHMAGSEATRQAEHECGSPDSPSCCRE